MRYGWAAASGVLVFLVIAGPAPAGPVERLAAQRLVDGAGVTAVAVADPATGAIQALRGLEVPLARAGQAPAPAVRDWLLGHVRAFGLDPAQDDLVLERDEPRRGGGRRLLFRQVSHGLPVAGADVRCVTDGEGSLRSVGAMLVPGIAAPPGATIGAERAGEAAAGALGVRLEDGPAEARLWLRRREGGDRLEWEVRVPLGDGRRSSSWVDARDGEVRSLDEGIAHAVGRVFPTDPRGPEAEVPLPRLSTPERLRSRAVAIEEQLGSPATPLGPDGDFRYPSTTLEFDQVNAYWHCDRFVNEFLGGLGYPGPPESLIVRVHSPLEPNVALTSGRYIHLGRPIPGFTQEVSRCQDIVYHELVHAVLFGEGILAVGVRREAGALHEALADYFAASCTGDAAIGEWLYLAFPQGATRVDRPAEPWHVRNYDQLSFGAAGVGSAWANGMIVSSALWDLRARLGATADSLVLESLEHLPTEPLWAHFANALLEADIERHARRSQAAIVEVLAGRGFRGSAVAAMTGPFRLEPGQAGEFRALACCGGVTGEYRWRARGWCRGVPCGGWRPLGEGPVLSASFDEDTELALDVFSPWGDTLATTRFVNVLPPELWLEGPDRVVQHGVATWRARAIAMGPVRFRWERQWRRPKADPVFIGDGGEVTFAADTSCELRLRLTDGFDREVELRRSVETFADRPPGGGALLAASQRLDAGARVAETHLEVGRSGRLTALVLDVRGRVRARPWDGPIERGGHVVRWDAGGLEPGVYFLRVTFESKGAVERFVVIR